mmetsp:Transcript_70913/g.182847  ORF Transcript_70913/g.182847 Transcript_70913/m.182847 type:complete len:144 (-) Transcript_70913:100-531(-)
MAITGVRSAAPADNAGLSELQARAQVGGDAQSALPRLGLLGFGGLVQETAPNGKLSTHPGGAIPPPPGLETPARLELHPPEHAARRQVPMDLELMTCIKTNSAAYEPGRLLRSAAASTAPSSGSPSLEGSPTRSTGSPKPRAA